MLKISWSEKLNKTKERDELARRVQMLKEENEELRKCIFDSLQEQEVPDCMVNARKLIKVIRQMRGMLVTGPRALSFEGTIYFLDQMERRILEEACKKGEEENE